MNRTYVIGDIHGCYREFQRLLDLCSDHTEGRPSQLITLGDYVDRGPESFGVVQLIRHRLAGEYPVFRSIVNLKGNHEDMMVQAVLGGELRDKQSWVSSNNGGNATVESYPNREFLLDDAKWLAALPTSCEDKLRYYVHAGIRPGIRLKEQSDADKMWIRDLFLKHKAPHEKYVVYGHTPVRKPDVQSNRINIDTALVFGGRLTAAVFEDSQAEAVDLLQVKTMSLEQQI
jgi:serine/threonine protein phosphatase 1